MVHKYRFLTAIFALTTAIILTGPVYAKKHEQHDGKPLVESKLKTNGEHMIGQKGEHKVFAKVQDGKIAGLHVKHDKKGDVPVKKYKTKKKMAQADGFMNASYQVAQYQDLGMTWIGYAYIDDYGDEQIYWFPYEMIWDGDTGAIEYVPL